MIPLRLVLENFISHVKSELDFTKFDAALLIGAHSGNPYVSNGVGKCLPGDTTLYDECGSPIQIESVVTNRINSVLGFSNNSVKPVRIKNWFKLGKKRTLKITLQSGSSLTMAVTHPILTPDGCVVADKLEVGQWVAEVRKFPCTQKNYNMSEEKNNFSKEIFWNKIISIEDCGYKKCFDIEVDTPEHLYIANTFIVHNSAVFDGMRWALTNKSRFSTKDKVVKRGKPLCKVTFEFMIDNEQYRIVRKLNKRSNLTDVGFFRKVGNKWEDDGLTCDTPTMTNRKIMEVIRMSDDTFVNSVYFKQNDISGFASATTSKRKEILKEVLQIGIWDEFQQVAKSSVKQFEDQRANLEERLKIIGDVTTQKKENQAKIKKLEEQMGASKADLEKMEEELDAQKQVIGGLETIVAQKGGFNLSDLKEEKKSLSARANEIKEKRKELTAQVKANNKILENEKYEELEEQLLNISERILKTSRIGGKKAREVFTKYSDDKPPVCQYSQADLDRKKEQLEIHRNTLNGLKQDLSNLKSVRPGKECPTCLSQIKNPKDIARRRRERKKSLLSQIEEAEAFVNDLTTSVKREQNAIDRAKEALVELERTELALSRKKSKVSDAARRNEVIQIELKNLRAAWDKLREEYDKVKAILDNVKGDKNIHAELDRAKVKHNGLLEGFEKARSEFLELSVQHGMLKGYGEELERRDSERSVISGQLSKVSREVDIYKKLVKAFGKDGIQAIIMENITEDLRKYANSVLKQICSDPMTIDFVTQKQTGSGSWKEQFDIRISVGSSELDFDDLSGGEQVRISIALRLALSQLLMRRVGSNVKFLLLDEVDQALDRHGIDALASAILNLSKNLKILVITHNEGMKEKFENIITIQKGASGSVLKQ